MEPSRRTTSLNSPSYRPSDLPLRNPFTASGPEPSDLREESTGNLTRRGHSDEDLRVNASVPSRSHRQVPSREDPSWLDFVMQPSERQERDRASSDMAARRRAIMAEDRRRRLSDRMEEHNKRPSMGMPFNHHMHPRPRHSPTASSSDRALLGPLNNPKNQFLPRIIDRPLPRRPSEESLRDRPSRELKLPKWQPDEQVSKCPICGIMFTFWYRKHHCRKCGRVVCANCSPHRITIPRQFIIHPPETAAQSPRDRNKMPVEIVDLTNDDVDVPRIVERPQSSDYRIDPALGGGQEVRLCNPCVPDPNPLPHMPYQPRDPPPVQSRPRAQHRSFGEERGSSSHQWQPFDPVRPPLTSRTSSDRQDPRQLTTHATDFNANLNSFPSFSSRRHSHAPHPTIHAMAPPPLPIVYGSAPDQAFQQSSHENLQHRQRHPHQYHRHHASVGAPPTTSRTFHIPELQPVALRQPARPRLQLKEEDECPVCFEALPPKGPDGSEVAREAHVAACVESRFSTSVPNASRPPPAAAIEAAVAASAATPLQASGRPVSIIEDSHRDSAAAQGAPRSLPFQQRRRTAGMVNYHATEKDCVGEGGEGEAECVICFEEFAVGDEMGRLECLCKFHNRCIRQWWQTKGPGACPVHQEGT